MKCWRCGKEISDGTRECLYCHTDQRRSTPQTEVGKAMRQLYDHYGAEAVLTNPVLLSNGLGDVITDSLAVNLKKFKNQLRMAMDAGVGKMYLDQISSSGKPDSDFDSRVNMILTEDVGMNDKTAAELITYFDEMIGWRENNSQPEDPKKNGLSNSELEQKEAVYQEAYHLMDSATIFELQKASRLFQSIYGYKDAEQMNKLCNGKIDKLEKEETYKKITRLFPQAQKTDDYKYIIALAEEIRHYKDTNELIHRCNQKIEEMEKAHKRSWNKLILLVPAILVIAFIVFGISNNQRQKEFLSQTQTASVIHQTQQAIEAIQTRLAESSAMPSPKNVLEKPSILSLNLDDKGLLRIEWTEIDHTDYYEVEYCISDYCRLLIRTSKTAYTQSPREDMQGTVDFVVRACSPGRSDLSGNCGDYSNLYTYIFPIKTPQIFPTPTPESSADLDVDSVIKMGETEYNAGNYVSAVSYFRQAAEQGNSYGQAWLGSCYRNGYGVTQNDTEAFKWFKLSADQGYTWAQNMLGDCYYYGRGISQSNDNALYYYRLAAQQGNTYAQEMIDRITKPITTETPTPMPAMIPTKTKVPTPEATSTPTTLPTNTPDPDFYIENGVLKKYKGSASRVTIPDGVTSIGDLAFYNNSLSSVSIPNSVTSIGDSAFSDCSSLTSVTIPDGVTSIGNMAFDDCSSLTSVTIPNSVTSIGDWVFSRCSSLTSVTIPNSVTSIGNSAFSECSSLTSVTIPNSVTSIGDWVFSSCSSLTSVTIPNSVTSIGNSAFSECSSLTSVTIPNSITSIGKGAFSDCSGLTSVTIPNSVTSIRESAFEGCISLASVTIPNSVTSIGDYAFFICNSLTSVTIPNSVTSIGKNAFNWNNVTLKVPRNSYAERWCKENMDSGECITY